MKKAIERMIGRILVLVAECLLRQADKLFSREGKKYIGIYCPSRDKMAELFNTPESLRSLLDSLGLKHIPIFEDGNLGNLRPHQNQSIH